MTNDEADANEAAAEQDVSEAAYTARVKARIAYLKRQVPARLEPVIGCDQCEVFGSLCLECFAEAEQDGDPVPALRAPNDAVAAMLAYYRLHVSSVGEWCVTTPTGERVSPWTATRIDAVDTAARFNRARQVGA